MRLTGSILVVFVLSLLLVDSAMAQQAAAEVGDRGWAMIGIAIAAVGGALSQSKGLSVALDGIARNPGAAGQMFVPMLLGLVFIESLVIYALVIALKLVGII